MRAGEQLWVVSWALLGELVVQFGGGREGNGASCRV